MTYDLSLQVFQFGRPLALRRYVRAEAGKQIQGAKELNYVDSEKVFDQHSQEREKGPNSQFAFGGRRRPEGHPGRKDGQGRSRRSRGSCSAGGKDNTVGQELRLS